MDRPTVTRSVVLVVFGLAGAFVGGAAGSVWAALVANLIAIAVAWHQFQATQRGHMLAASDQLASRPGQPSSHLAQKAPGSPPTQIRPRISRRWSARRIDRATIVKVGLEAP